MGATPTTTPTTTNDTRKVWVFELKEVISHDFEVVAKSKAEALRLLEEHQHNHAWDSDEFNLGTSDHVVHRVDGSHQWHKDMAAQLIDKYDQKLVTKETRYVNEKPYKVWKRYAGCNCPVNEDGYIVHGSDCVDPHSYRGVY